MDFVRNWSAMYARAFFCWPVKTTSVIYAIASLAAGALLATGALQDILIHSLAHLYRHVDAKLAPTSSSVQHKSSEPPCNFSFSFKNLHYICIYIYILLRHPSQKSAIHQQNKVTMAHTLVRFEFHYGGIGTKAKPFMVVHHDIPTVMIREDAQEWHMNNAQVADMHTSTVTAFVESHKSTTKLQALRSGKMCVVCDKLPTTVQLFEMPFLHEILDPSVEISVAPLCGKPHCTMVNRQWIARDLKALDDRSDTPEYRAAHPELGNACIIATCEVCRQAGGVEMCERCETVGYCGFEHKKQDWKEHKQVCAALAKAKKALL